MDATWSAEVAAGLAWAQEMLLLGVPDHRPEVMPGHPAALLRDPAVAISAQQRDALRGLAGEDDVTHGLGSPHAGGGGTPADLLAGRPHGDRLGPRWHRRS